MARPTPHYDRAEAISDELLGLAAMLEAREADATLQVELLRQRGLIEASLAVAEALHGVIYVGNANAV